MTDNKTALFFQPCEGGYGGYLQPVDKDGINIRHRFCEQKLTVDMYDRGSIEMTLAYTDKDVEVGDSLTDDYGNEYDPAIKVIGVKDNGPDEAPTVTVRVQLNRYKWLYKPAFNIGDIVGLQSFGPKMTVTDILPYDHGKVEVTWFGKDGSEPHTAKYQTKALKLLNENDEVKTKWLGKKTVTPVK